MRFRVANKRRFKFWCIVFVVIILIMFFNIGKRLAQFKESGDSLIVSSSNKVLAANEGGSISLKENEYFKQYTITCKNKIENVNWKESGNFIGIYVGKDNIEKLGLKGDKADSNIYYDNSGDDFVIKFKKGFNENNFVYLDKESNKKIIILVSKKENPYKHVVVLDAGHGGEDIGANVDNTYEKDITLKITDYTEKELLYRGFNIVKTRDEDKLIPLGDIGKIANASSADIFLSVHINFNNDSVYKGVSTYYYAPQGYEKEERIKLAQTIQKEIVKSDAWEDRGILTENFQVLRDTKMPSVLLECGFLSNYDDRQKLLNDEALKNFAVNISNGVENYFAGSESSEE